MTSSEANSPNIPGESDDTLEPVDVSESDDQRLLFYLAGRVPVSLKDLAEDTKQSLAGLREYFYAELESEIDIDSTGFVRLTDSARNPVLRASKPYIRAGQDQFDSGRSAMDQDLYEDALADFEQATKRFEQVRSRLQAVNYQSEKLAERIETTRNSIEVAQDVIAESADRIEAIADDTDSDTESASSPDTASVASGTDDREAMMTLIRNMHQRLERVPKTTELPEGCEYSPYDFYNEFGSWDEALEAAGIDKRQALLDDIHRVAEKIGRVPRSTDMDEHGTYVGSTYSSYFGSWSTALEQAGLEENREDELIETLRSLEDRLGRLPKGTDLQDLTDLSQQDYIRNFGSWDQALEAAGINKEQYLIDDLRQVARDIGSTPSTPDADKLGEYSSAMYQEYFGSWDAALEAAGLASTDTGTAARRETDQESGDITTLGPATPLDEIQQHVDGVGNSSIHAVKKAGYETLGEVRDAEPREITKYKGIGRGKAVKLIRFAAENVSTDGTSSKRSSSNSQGTDRSSSSTVEPSLDRLDAEALDTSWKTIPNNERIQGQFLLQLTEVERRVGARKAARLDVRDQNGREFVMDIWSKHDVDRGWGEGAWYAIENARGKVWESGDGTMRKRLSSTRDFEVVELGTDFDSANVSAGASSEPEPGSPREPATTEEAGSTSTTASSSSGDDTTPMIDNGDSNDDTQAEADGLVGEIMSDLEDF